MIGLHRALRALDTAEAIGAAACGFLAARLHSGRAIFAEAAPHGWTVLAAAGPGAPRIGETLLRADYGEAHRRVLDEAGEVFAPDVTRDPRTVDAAPRLRARGVGALLHLALVEEGAAVALLAVESPEARSWSLEEIGSAELAAEAVWAALARVHARERLLAAEFRLGRACAAAGFGVYEYDPIAQRFVAEEGMERALGAAVPDDGFLAVEAMRVHPDDRARVRAEVAALRRRLGPYALEFRVLRPDGEVRWALDRGECLGPLDAATGLGRRVVGGVTDVTERKRAELALRDRVEELESLLVESPVGISLARDPACRDVWVNPALRRTLRLGPADDASIARGLETGALRFALRRDGAPVGPEALPLERVCATGRPMMREQIEVGFDDGGSVCFDISAQPLFDAEGRVRGAIAFSIDMSERRAAEAALARRHEELTAIYDTANVGLCVIDRDARYLRVNAYLARMHGRPASEHIGRTVREIAPSIADRVERLVAEIVATGRGVTDLEVSGATLAAPGDRRHWVEHWLPIKDASGAVVAVNVAIEDVTARRRAEEAVRRSEAEARARAAEVEAIYDAAPVGLVLFDVDFRFVRVNPLMAAMNGRAPEAMIGRSIEEVLPPVTVAALRGIEPRLRAGEDVLGLEIVGIDPAGEEHAYIVSYRPLRDAQGAVSAYLGTVLDISERKRAERALARSRDTYLALIENHAFGVFLIDAGFRLARVSRGAARLFETVGPPLGRDFAEILRILWPEPFAGEAEARFRATLATGEPHQAEAVERRADTGAVEAYDWRIERVTLPDGLFGVVCFFYDLTERRRAEAQIGLLNREVEHRARNMLSVVLAVARQTAASSPAEFLPRFERRIEALAASQDLLVRGAWTAVGLADLVTAQLGPFADLVGERIALDGAPLDVAAGAAQMLGMAIHELAVNAGRHGALAAPAGRVTVSWRVYGDAFSLVWTERGGPPVSPPARRGFGSAVLGALLRGSFGGETTLAFEADGLAWRLACPAGRVLAAPPAAAGGCRALRRP